jgi:hypothetical protein
MGRRIAETGSRPINRLRLPPLGRGSTCARPEPSRSNSVQDLDPTLCRAAEQRRSHSVPPATYNTDVLGVAGNTTTMVWFGLQAQSVAACRAPIARAARLGGERRTQVASRPAMPERNSLAVRG